MNTSLEVTHQLKNLHEQAIKSADSAIEYAKQAGALLLSVKKELPHGQFLSWLQSLGFLDVRMAQRYMAVASGKPYTIGGRAVKNDVASYLENMPDERSSGNWIPWPGHWYASATDKAAFWVVPWDQNEKWFHVSKLYKTGEVSTEEEDMFEEISYYVGTNSPIPSSMVDGRLKYYGLDSPTKVEWIKRNKPGTERPFGEPEAYQEKLKSLAKSADNEQTVIE